MNHFTSNDPLVWKSEEKQKNKLIDIWDQYGFALLLIIAFFVDLLTPYLIWKRFLPSASRWIADGAVLGMVILVFLRMVVFDRIPKGFLVILAITAVWTTVAFFEGQRGVVTVWGWWRMLKYPMLGIFAYLQPTWPEKLPQKIRDICFTLIKIEVVWQLYQYLAGEKTGDNLAGSFGRHGVGPLTMFLMFVLCIALGEWLAKGKTQMMIWTIILGAVASGLGEMKIFPAALLLLAVVTLIIHMIRGGQFRKLIVYIAVFSIVVPVFINFYNVVVAEANGSRRFEEYFELDTTEDYLNNVYVMSDGRFYIGRGFALQLGWDVIQRDLTTFLFGYGLGTRSESVSLGIVGAALDRGYYGATAGTSLLVIMQEMGIGGLAILAAYILWVLFILFNDIRLNQDGSMNVLRFAIILYTITWPLWIWYHQAWDFGVSMLLYWACVGIVLQKSPSIHNHLSLKSQTQNN